MRSWKMNNNQKLRTNISNRLSNKIKKPKKHTIKNKNNLKATNYKIKSLPIYNRKKQKTLQHLQINFCQNKKSK